MTDRQTLDLTPKKGIVMFHTCLCMDASTGEPVHVTISTNPLEFDAARFKAQIVMHKTRSHNCAVQVARFVRRSFDIETPVSTLKSNRPIEAMIGYACTRTMTYPPSYVREEVNEVVRHIAATSIAALLEEVANGINAARIRYVVYEVRSKNAHNMRAVTNKYHSVERIWRQCPPDTLASPDVVHIAKCATREEAEKLCEGYPKVSDALWTRRPDPKYMARLLVFGSNEDLDVINWRADGTLAVRTYDSGRVVVVGPHVYTLEHVQHCLARGAWYDGQFRKSTMPEDVA